MLLHKPQTSKDGFANIVSMLDSVDALPVSLDMTNSRLMLVDSNDYTASVLIDDLRRRGLGYIHWVASTLELPKMLEAAEADIVVVNYHSDQPDNLMVCSTIKLLAPLAATVVIVSPGPALKAVRQSQLKKL